MLTATRRVLDPNDPRYAAELEQPDYINDPNAPVEPSASGPVAPKQEPSAPQEAPKPTDPTLEAPPPSTGGGVMGITQLPDGGGGTVPVPPPELAPTAPLINPIPTTPTLPGPTDIGGSIPLEPTTPTDTTPSIPIYEPPTIDPLANEPQAPLVNPIPITEPIAAPPPPVDVAPPPPVVPVPLPTEPEAAPTPPPTPFPGATAASPPPTPPPIADVPLPEPGQAVTGAAVQQPAPLPEFGPDENLIASQVLPTPDPRMLALQQSGDEGLDALAAEAPIVPQADPRLLRYREETDKLMDEILKGPDRLEMAKQFYRNFDQETEQDYLDSLQDATDMGAAHGQLFSGQLTNKYGDLFQRRARDKDAAKNRFLDEALRETFGDRDRAFSKLGDVESRIYGQGQDERGELRGERENRRRLISDYYNERDKALATGRSDREETRGERDYQQGSAEAALLNRIRQYMAEQGAEQQDFNNAGDLFGMGSTGDPTQTYMNAAEQQALEAAAAAGDTGALLRLLAMRRQGAGQGTQPAGG